MAEQVEAVLWTGSEESLEEVRRFCPEACPVRVVRGTPGQLLGGRAFCVLGITSGNVELIVPPGCYVLWDPEDQLVAKHPEQCRELGWVPVPPKEPVPGLWVCVACGHEAHEEECQRPLSRLRRLLSGLRVCGCTFNKPKEKRS